MILPRDIAEMHMRVPYYLIKICSFYIMVCKMFHSNRGNIFCLDGNTYWIMTGRQKVMMICEKMNIIAWIILTLVKKDLVSKWWLHQIKSLLKSSNKMLYIFHNLELIFVVRRPHFRHKLMVLSDSVEIIVFFKKGFILSLFCHVQFFLQLMIKTLQITKAERNVFNIICILT